MTLVLVSQSLKTSVSQCGAMITNLIIISFFPSAAPQNVLKSKEPSFLTTRLPPNSHGPSSSPSVNVSAHLPPVQSPHFEQVDKTSPYMLICRGQNGTPESKHTQLEVAPLHTTIQMRDLTSRRGYRAGLDPRLPGYRACALTTRPKGYLTISGAWQECHCHKYIYIYI